MSVLKSPFSPPASAWVISPCAQLEPCARAVRIGAAKESIISSRAPTTGWKSASTRSGKAFTASRPSATSVVTRFSSARSPCTPRSTERRSCSPAKPTAKATARMHPPTTQSVVAAPAAISAGLAPACAAPATAWTATMAIAPPMKMATTAKVNENGI